MNLSFMRMQVFNIVDVPAKKKIQQSVSAPENKGNVELCWFNRLMAINQIVFNTIPHHSIGPW